MSHNEDGSVFATSSRPVRARWHLVAVVAGLVALGLVATILLTGPPDGSGTAGGHLCSIWGTQAEVSRDFCDRVSADAGRRGRITEAQRADAEAAFTRIEHVPMLLGSCFTERGMPCAREHERRPPTQADVDRLSQDTAREGFSRSSARIADDDDPAPEGSLLYAIQVDDQTCVIGYLRQVPSGLSGHDVVGTLPHGGCLDS
ncbi:hypothetical protein FHS29_006455 [Saccharothrix tamanrassetensis]|uniref:Uncharacterized protein n=1 Tax=Saccharothrix tamanrassetensis TaxID=1051531 RepID=A0A841CU43_9PSEU|nr:hypothetical protein [Saccharothrix tamanrassetensis]MBB5959834.1 hypothetical protein [Saccharothrix tamanrassetensis]